MKKNLILAVSFLMMSSVAMLAQNKVIEHKVEKGDTVSSIARQYNVSPSDIYRLNPDVTEGVKLDAVVKVPVGKAIITSPKKHIVEAGENFYSISRKYNISPADLKLANKTVDNEKLKTGSVLVIPSKSTITDTTKAPVKTVTIPQITPVSNPVKSIYHTVTPKETKFGIAKQHGLTIEELENLNPEIKGGDSIEVGLVLRLTYTVPPYGSITTKDYIIQPQETLFSLSQKAGLSEDEFLKLNPSLNNGVLAGATIKMPSTLYVSTSLNKPVTDLTQNLSKYATKNLVLLLPFNTDKVGSNKGVTIQDQLKGDKFLNMTLDFYAGALVAIDSAKKLGLPLKVQVLDSKENKTSSNIVSLYNNGSFAKSDAIVGPFFQNHAEALATILENQNTPIISPLSNEKGKPIANLYQSMPTSNDVKKKMIDYMYANNGNIIAVVDPKKGSSRKYISETFPAVKMASILETGNVDATQFKQLLDKKRTNFVILETENTNLILSACKTLISNNTEYPIQLVTLDKNETLESEEISLTDLMKLKLLYPSVTRDVNQLTPSSFAKAYKAYNNAMPNKFATRGFDVTFDTILRLFNQEGFKATIDEVASEQIENKFNYINIDGAYYNKGIYLMYYDSDLTVKEAN